MTMRTIAILVALSLFGCSKKDTPAPSPPPAVSATPVASSAPVVEAKPEALIFKTSVASFNKNVLDECTDLTIRVFPPSDAGVGWKPAVDPTDVLKKTKGVTPIAAGCEEQFKDRTMLAFCVVTPEKRVKNKDGSESLGVISSSYYNFSTIGVDDVFMNQCLERGGKWKAEPRDSQAWQKAKREHASRELKGAIKQLEDQAPSE